MYLSCLFGGLHILTAVVATSPILTDCLGCTWQVASTCRLHSERACSAWGATAHLRPGNICCVWSSWAGKGSSGRPPGRISRWYALTFLQSAWSLQERQCLGRHSFSIIIILVWGAKMQGFQPGCLVLGLGVAVVTELNARWNGHKTVDCCGCRAEEVADGAGRIDGVPPRAEPATAA